MTNESVRPALDSNFDLAEAVARADLEEMLPDSLTPLGAQSGLAAAERDLGYARLALHRALGGAWTIRDRQASRQQGSAGPEDTARILANSTE